MLSHHMNSFLSQVASHDTLSKLLCRIATLQNRFMKAYTISIISCNIYNLLAIWEFAWYVSSIFCCSIVNKMNYPIRVRIK